MRGPLFRRYLLRIYLKRTKGERLLDLETLYSIIVAARRGLPRPHITEQIALSALCFFAWPGKAPRYRMEIVTFRRNYIGIAHSREMQEDFRARLTDAILDADSIEQLEFNKLSDIFRTDNGSDWSEGAEGRFIPGGTMVTPR